MATSATPNDDRTDPNDQLVDGELADDLQAAVDALERVRWHDVPDVGAETASTFALRLEAARELVLRGELA